MRWSLILLLGLLAFSPAAVRAEGKVIKVLPQFLDLQGRHAIAPSLYDRDAYQAYLRKHPAEISGIRYAVNWKAKTANAALKLRVELRGTSHGDLPRETKVEMPVTPHHYSHWTNLELGGSDYKAFGEITAWRVTLWDGDQLLGEQKSFLW